MSLCSHFYLLNVIDTLQLLNVRPVQGMFATPGTFTSKLPPCGTRDSGRTWATLSLISRAIDSISSSPISFAVEISGISDSVLP